MGWVSGSVGKAALLVGALALAACKFQDGQPGGGATGDALTTDSSASSDSMTLTDAGADATQSMADASADAATKMCPAAYVLTSNSFPGSRYRSVTSSATWGTAEADCADDDSGGVFAPAHLVVLDSDTERAYAFNVNNSDQWAGAADINTEGTLQAVTDQPNPDFGAATGNQQSKDCLMLNSTGTLLESCANAHPYLCECDGRAENPANF